MRDNMRIQITFTSSKHKDWTKGIAILSMLGLCREGFLQQTLIIWIEEWMLQDIEFELIHRGVQCTIEEYEEL